MTVLVPVTAYWWYLYLQKLRHIHTNIELLPLPELEVGDKNTAIKVLFIDQIPPCVQLYLSQFFNFPALPYPEFVRGTIIIGYHLVLFFGLPFKGFVTLRRDSSVART